MTKRCLLFDLDGTLIDTAPDMQAALNRIRAEENLPALDMLEVRPHVSRGGLALTQLGFADTHLPEQIEALRQRFLESYRQHICELSHLFMGMDEVLEFCESQQIPWGIVTNKPEWLSYPLLQQMQLQPRLCSMICGDTTRERKPHPLPLLTASQECGVAAEHCIYVGDDPRDIEAGRAANMTTVAASWGYIGADTDLRSWQADHIAHQPQELIALLETA